MRIKTIQDVVDSHLCCGCGACAHVAPDRYQMVDFPLRGRRPQARTTAPIPPETEMAALAVCPGRRLEHRYNSREPGLIPSLSKGWGPVREVREGYASDPEIRHRGSSGGVITALSLYCIEQGGFGGVLHTQASAEAPHINATVLSTTREQVLRAAGSRYSPASPCEALDLVEKASKPSVFVGKPCDVAGTENARAINRELDRKIGLTISIFCAGTPTTRATVEMLEKMGIADPSSLSSLRYRGMGWPGNASARFRGPAGEETRELSYEDAWGSLQESRPWRCYMCIDHSGEWADVSVGDPWYRPREEGALGRSLIVVRTERGRRAVLQAEQAGYLVVESAPADALALSQPSFLEMRGKVWARILASRIIREPAPVYRRMAMGRFWLRVLTPAQKIRAFVGTGWKILKRRAYEKSVRVRLNEGSQT